ncbi:MAG TPA: hypothetical protein VK065_05410 [Brevibacterium sp.]|nr:hypothetical protein [Brevibacterium sp.]
MQLNEIRRVYDGQEPFVTVYLEGRSPAEDAQQQVRLRWEELRRRLSEEGASDRVLSSLDEAVLAEEPGEVQSNGRVLVADATGVVLDQAWDAALGAGDAAHLGTEPELGAFVRERARSPRLLVAIADRHGAVVRQVVVTQSPAADTRVEDHVGDASEDPDSVHKPREGALSHKNIQRRADEVVKQNVREVAEHMDAVAKSWKPDLVVLAGGVQGRTALRNELSPALQEHFTETDAGGAEDDGAEEALANELHRLAEELSIDAARQRADQFGAAKARGLAVEGSDRISRALEMGAVETLLLEYDRNAARESELLAASVRTDAEAALVDSEVTDGVAAILRFEVPDR